MRISTIMLSGLLVLQLAVTVKIYWSNQQQQQQLGQPQALFDIRPGKVDQVVISDGEQSVTLQRTAEGWQLPALQDLPANKQQVATLLQSVTALKPAWPVATTAASQQQLEVAADNYQRQITLSAKGASAGELFVGTSPGFKQAHVRSDGSDAIYSVALNSFDIPASGDDWLDKSLLGAGDLERIEGADFTLRKQDEQWAFAASGDAGEQAEGQARPELIEDQAKQLASALKGLRIESVASEQPEGEAIELSVASADGDWTYRFVQADNQYYVSRNDVSRNDVSRNDRETLFTVSKYDFDRIAGIGLAQLAQSDAPAEEAAAAGVAETTDATATEVLAGAAATAETVEATQPSEAAEAAESTDEAEAAEAKEAQEETEAAELTEGSDAAGSAKAAKPPEALEAGAEGVTASSS